MTTLLFVTELRLWPPHGGEKIHACHIIACLSRLAQVTVLAPQPPADCPLLGQVQGWCDLPGVPVSFHRRVAASPFVMLPRPLWRRRLEKLLDALRPQIVWFNYGHWGHYAALAQQQGALTVMQTHNVQSRLAWQGLASRPLSRWHLYYAARAPLEELHERLLFRRFDRVLSVSEADRRAHASLVGEVRSLYLPNFLDEAWYHLDVMPPREAELLVMTGNFGAFQNQAGVAWFVDRVWPLVQAARPNARLLLVGAAPPGWRERMLLIPGIACTGSVATVAPYLRRATVAIVPLRHGSGTRFKVLEALACATPLVSTTIGAEGMALEDGVHARLADTPAAFAGAVLELLADAEARQALAAHGMALLRTEYTTAVNAARLEHILIELAELAA